MAAKSIENAAIIMQQQLNKVSDAAESYKEASRYYLAHGSSDRAAEALEKAAK
jgi:hypothetical protein